MTKPQLSVDEQKIYDEFIKSFDLPFWQGINLTKSDKGVIASLGVGVYRQGAREEREKVLREVENEVKGMMSMYEHMGFKGKVVCETCGEMVEAGSACENSRYFDEWKRLNELVAKFKQMKGTE